MAERHASNEVELKDLSHRAEILSHNLNKLCNDCGHESTSTDISRVADELILLATELRNLDRAVKNAQNQYTDTFNEDLGEICHQLGSIFEDTSDCCQEMHKTDKPGTSAIGWLRKKKYVEKLQKHLEANKTTLIVMRTVFHHGKKYGLQK